MKRHREGRRAFTLIELLVAMGIVGVLVALLIPAVRAMRAAAARAEAQRDIAVLETAITAYCVENGRFPLQAGNEPQHQYTPDEHRRLISALRGFPTADNPKRTIHLNISDRELEGGQWVDPWEQPYQIWADYDGDGAIAIAEPGFTLVLKGRRVAVWSRGEDHLSATPSDREDDVVSWDM